MTKREYLESIGYKKEWWWWEDRQDLFWKYYKDRNGTQFTIMYINIAKNKYFVELAVIENIENQTQIDDLQIAFNNVKRDFEEMQKYD